MARDRKDIHKLLKEILGSANVYFQPPESRKMEYPAIRYNLDTIDDIAADDEAYLRKKVYKLTYISNDPDSDVIDKLCDLKFCKHISHYTSENLNHDMFTITW